MNKIKILSILIFVFAACKQTSSDFSIIDFGASTDTNIVNTKAIQSAIDKAAEKGGRVVIPAGKFITGTFYLKSNVELYLMSGAEIIGSTNIDDYPIKEGKSTDRDRHPYHLVVMEDCHNVAITGFGVIDGNGLAFWKTERPSQWHFYTEKDKRPSPMIEVKNCKNIQFSGITIANSPGWTLHLMQSDAVKVLGITIHNNLLGPNTDGIDINGCNDVIVGNCNIKAGDDAVVLKTTRDSRPCKNVVVTGCILETNCVAMKLGTESHHNFSDVIFANNIVKNCSRVFSLICNDGATMNNIRVANITAQTNSGWILNRVIEVNANKRNDSSKVGHIKNVFIDGMNVRTDGRILLGAANGSTVENVHLKNINLSYAMLDDPAPMIEKTENDVFFFKSLPWLRGVQSAIAAENIDGLYVDDISVQWPTYPIDTTWRLLQSSQTWGNDNYSPQNKQAIMNGTIQPKFEIFKTKNVTNLHSAIK